MPETSIIVRAFNEERHLPALFDSFDAQKYRDFEVLLVDSGSFDRTRDIAGRRGARLVRVAPHDFTFGHSLNAGIREASGLFIAVVSAHALPCDPYWLENLIRPLRDGKTAMVYGRQYGDKRSRFSEILDFERTYGWQEDKVLALPDCFANNANSALRRDLWEQHAFDESLPGLEDIEWAKHWMERGRTVVYSHQAGIFHIHEESWSQLRRRYHREGKAAKWIGVLNRRRLPAEAVREAYRTLSDLYFAARNGRLSREAAGIIRFRYEKLRGTVEGVLDGAAMDNPLAREELLFDRRFRAVVVRGPDQAELEELDLPAAKPSEVLVRIAYEGVCGTDLEVLRGTLGYYKNGMAHYPIVPGHELCGTVVAVGPRAADSSLREGDPVVVECIQGCGDCPSCMKGNPIGCPQRAEVGVIGRNGGYAEYMLTPARFAHKIPGELGMLQACLCEPTAVVLKALRRIQHALAQPRTCAVVGAGTIGQLCARILVQRGHTVTAFDRNEGRLSLMAESAIRTATRLEGLQDFDIVVEATGDSAALEAVLRETAAGATILLLGLPYGSIPFDFESVVGYDKTIVGSVGSGSAEFHEALEVLPAIETGAFLDTVLPLDDFSRAWALAESGEHLKIVLKVSSEEA